jgi:hypothetical protein
MKKITKELTEQFLEIEVRVTKSGGHPMYGLIKLVTDDFLVLKTPKGKSVIRIDNIIEITEHKVRW